MRTCISKIAAATLAGSLLTGCHGDLTSPKPVAAHGVLISFIFPGSCNNLCEPTPGIYTQLASIRITNTSSKTVYLAQCGDNVRIFQEHYDGSTWVPDGPAVTCPVSTTILTLGPRASLDSWRFLPAGQFRVHTSAATTAAETDFEIATSNTIVVN
ncbi:MAG: hypothetical protein M3Y64_03975 [Gemmatimonadota bacterium]|nr:hypothetical protein [Gemmatimonadota bacterium]